MFVVIKKTARKVLDETKFATREEAENYAEFANACAPRGVRYEVAERE